jgi:hypothetical protein
MWRHAPLLIHCWSQFPVSMALALARGRAGSLYMRLVQMKPIWRLFWEDGCAGKHPANAPADRSPLQRALSKHHTTAALISLSDPNHQPFGAFFRDKTHATHTVTNIMFFGHYPLSYLYLKTVMFSFQNTMFRRLDSVSIFRWNLIKTRWWIMSKNIIFVLMYHCHKLLDLIHPVTSLGCMAERPKPSSTWSTVCPG